MKIFDLSLPLKDGAKEPNPPKIVRSGHAEGIVRLGKIAGIAPEEFPGGMALATDVVTAGAHNGTHVDAPYHYGPESEGKPALTVDKVPLEWCYGPGVVLDMSKKEPGAEITVEDIRSELDRINYTVKPGDIVCIRTGCDAYWDTDMYMKMQSGLGIAGLEYILDMGVMTIGIDAWTLDRPVYAMVESFQQTGDKSYLWPVHFYGRKKSYLQIEKLAHLGDLPRPYGFTLSALPVMIDGATAGWCRAVAIFDDLN